ncbi:hypothetical protein EV401DRAFT_1978871 [Pisolithus croceorrhizus]|nr:hypothetical protein EV401DRAFT_1978871 [Pisolithus croceorrhizus]
MAQTSPVVVVGSSLQISPNLEALLQYDELTRGSTSSPTSSRPSLASTSSEFPFSLPPPPPRNSQSSTRKATLPETASPKGVRRRRGVKLGSDSWPDALLVAAPDPVSPGECNTTSATSIPNPYINPTPVVARIDSVIDDGPSTPKPGDMFIPTESPTQVAPDAPISSPESYTSQPSTAHRTSPALHKVEKMLSKGKDSLTMLATAATPGSLKQKSDSLELNCRCYRAETTDVDNLPAAKRYLTGTPRLSGTSVTYNKGGTSFSDTHAIAGSHPTKIKPSSGTAERYSGSAQPSAHSPNSDIASNRSLSISSTSSCSSLDVPTNPAREYPASSLPNLPLPSMTSGEERQHEDTQRVTDNGSLHSFIDFYSPSYADGIISCSERGDNSKNYDAPPRKRQLNLTIPPTKMYGVAPENPSLVSLATMTFAPPSPPIGDSPSQYTPNSPSSSSIALSTMVFAPPSPATELPSFILPRPDSRGSAASLTPIEFASPSTPVVGQQRKRELATAFKMASLRVRRGRRGKRSLSLSPRPQFQGLSPMPSTTNLLGRDERADLVRRNRKLTQVFGQTPGRDMSALDLQEPRRLKMPPLASIPLLGAGKQRNHRQAVSVSHGLVSSDAKTEPSSPWQIDDLWSLGDRRYSIPLTPSSFTFYFDDDTFRAAPANDHRGVHSLMDSPPLRDSSSSFIDLSDDEEVSRGDEAPTITSLDGHRMSGRRALSHFSSTPSFVDSLDPDRQAEAERRRKRERLAKLHRFLGSRIPPDLVLGSPADPPSSFSSSPPMEGFRDPWLRGQKGGVLDPHEYFDRGKEELDQREKALNVRRAQKMEKVFGTPPPQTLFHTRQGPSTLPHSQPSSPTGLTNTTNRNQSAYRGKSSYRPPPTESTRCLLPKTGRSSTSNRRPSIAQTSVYLDFEQSLNSLVDIIDRDDRESLLELHRFINSELPDLSFDVENVDNRRHSVSSSHRSERRHSLPSSSSVLSLTYDLHPVAQAATEFQVRRRRAAKLTSFFGVDYRDLIDDILESIERGVEEERGRGTLQPEEVEVLLYRVWSLKSMQGQQS